MVDIIYCEDTRNTSKLLNTSKKKYFSLILFNVDGEKFLKALNLNDLYTLKNEYYYNSKSGIANTNFNDYILNQENILFQLSVGVTVK